MTSLPKSVERSAVEILVPRRKRSRSDGATESTDEDALAEEVVCARERDRVFESFCASLRVVGEGERDLDIRPSTIANERAGLGLFVRSAVEADTPITKYEGLLVPYHKINEHVLTHMRTHARQRFAIDGTRLPDGTPITDPATQLHGLGGGAFANHAPRDSDACNARFDFVDSVHNERAFERFAKGGEYDFDPDERVTYLRATKPIAAGEEVLVDYGRDYLGFADESEAREP